MFEGFASARQLTKVVTEARDRANRQIAEHIDLADPTVLVLDPDNRRADRVASAAGRFQRPRYHTKLVRDERATLEQVVPSPWVLVARADVDSLDVVSLFRRVRSSAPYVELIALCSRASTSIRARLLTARAPFCMDMDELDEHLPSLLALVALRPASGSVTMQQRSKPEEKC